MFGRGLEHLKEGKWRVIEGLQPRPILMRGESHFQASSCLTQLTSQPGTRKGSFGQCDDLFAWEHGMCVGTNCFTLYHNFKIYLHRGSVSHNPCELPVIPRIEKEAVDGGGGEMNLGRGTLWTPFGCKGGGPIAFVRDRRPFLAALLIPLLAAPS